MLVLLRNFQNGRVKFSVVASLQCILYPESLPENHNIYLFISDIFIHNYLFI